VRYCLGEGRHPVTGELLPKRADGSSRVEWVGGTGFSFPIKTPADVDRARKIMELDAQNQGSKTRKCENDCVHLVLSWWPGEGSDARGHGGGGERRSRQGAWHEERQGAVLCP